MLSISTTGIGLGHGSVGFSTKPHTRKSSLAARWWFAVSLMLNLLYVHYVADLHVNGTPGTLDLQHPCRGLYITCTERKATALWGMWALGTLPCCGQGLWNSYSWCVAAVSWALGWVLSWAVLHSFILSFWWSIQRLWLRARSSWFLNYAAVNLVSKLQLCRVP